MKNYRIINHTADFALEIFGDNLEKLFIHAAFALIEIMFEKKVRYQDNFPYKEKQIKLKSEEPESLLIDWLREIFGLCIIEKEILVKINFLKITENKLNAKISVQKIDEIPNTEIKAITYNDVQIKETKTGLSCVIVCDV